MPWMWPKKGEKKKSSRKHRETKAGSIRREVRERAYGKDLSMAGDAELVKKGQKPFLRKEWLRILPKLIKDQESQRNISSINLKYNKLRLLKTKENQKILKDQVGKRHISSKGTVP